MYAILTTILIGDQEVLVVASLHDAPVDEAVLCGESVAIGDVYDGGGFFARAAFERGAPARTLEDARAEKILALEQFAASLRERVAGTNDASKLAVYQTKYETALAALDGQQWALDALTPEAIARGESIVGLATLVRSLGGQWRGAGLAIDAAYQTHKASLSACDSIEAADVYDITVGWPL